MSGEQSTSTGGQSTSTGEERVYSFLTSVVNNQVKCSKSEGRLQLAKKINQFEKNKRTIKQKQRKVNAIIAEIKSLEKKQDILNVEIEGLNQSLQRPDSQE